MALLRSAGPCASCLERRSPHLTSLLVAWHNSRRRLSAGLAHEAYQEKAAVADGAIRDEEGES